VAEHVRIPIDGMTCSSCAARLTRTIRRIDGVDVVRVDPASDSAVIAFDPRRVTLEVIAQAITTVGYAPGIPRAEPIAERRARTGVLARLATLFRS
jgi:P-type Cu+ transporter